MVALSPDERHGRSTYGDGPGTLASGATPSSDPWDASPFGVLGSLMPRGVVVVDVDPKGEPPALPPEEAEMVMRAVAKRRRELAWGRSCARRALESLGVDWNTAIGRGDRGEPLWPSGVVGSISHCAGYCVTAVADQAVIGGLGIDAEAAGVLPRGGWEMISTAAERGALARALGRPPGRYGIVLFSAKESIYKAWYPMTGQWLGFQDVDVLVDPATGTFRASLRIDVPPAVAPAWQAMEGRFAITASHVVTAVWLPHVESDTIVNETTP